jgi:hypothetical protein
MAVYLRVELEKNRNEWHSSVLPRPVFPKWANMSLGLLLSHIILTFAAGLAIRTRIRLADSMPERVGRPGARHT